MQTQDPQLTAEFIAESREHLSSIENLMPRLEQAPDASDVIHAVFREFHTIKGLAGFLEFPVMEEVAHEVETLLDLVRNAKLQVTASMVDVVLETADYLKHAIARLDPQRGNGHHDLVARIRRVSSGESLATRNKTPQPPTIANKPPESFSIRIESGKLDRLMDVVDEMVIAQSRIRHNPAVASIRNSGLQADLSQLARMTAEVQRASMSLRMVPIGQLFQRTARMVRDLSHRMGKIVEIETSGGDLEIDENVAEGLADPLLHMVRNSIDHGIEAPEERDAAGKSRTANLRLAASHKAGHIVIEVSDDGRGLDKVKILRKARERGLVPEGVPLPEADIFDFIFEPGFSTADKISDISGRGVGMDVVWENVQKLHGRIDIHSPAGRGTTFLLKLPLTASAELRCPG